MPQSPLRRALLAAAGLGGWPSARAAGAAGASAAADPAEDAIAPGRTLRFPRDHGAHPGARIEWWYATGCLSAPGQPADAEPAYGFQLTFFRSRTGLGGDNPSRFAPRQLLFAHAALTDLRQRRHRHAQRLQRWDGDEARPDAHARRADTALRLGPWWLRREPPPAAAPAATVAAPSRYLARLAAPEAGLWLDLQLDTTQPLLLQGEAGHSRKGPETRQASHYYSQPQLAVQARIARDGGPLLAGRGWLDHEWSNELLAPGAVGWDWCGLNLDDGGALTAFVLRRADGGVLWAGGSHRAAGGTARDFAPHEVRFTALRHWTSPTTGARYPVAWRIETPAASGRLEALLDAQELDSRASTGAVYWEGLAAWHSEAADGTGPRRRGLGYLEMTGRLAPLALGA